MSPLVLIVLACVASGECAEHTAPLPEGTVVDPRLPGVCLRTSLEWARANPGWTVRRVRCGPLEYRL